MILTSNTIKTYTQPAIQLRESIVVDNLFSERKLLIMNLDTSENLDKTIKKILNRAKNEYSQTFQELAKQ